MPPSLYTMKKSLLDLIGNTPLLQIPCKLSGRVSLYAKLEFYNPGGSVKDRPVKWMLDDAIKKSEIRGRTLIDATSGNTGIAYAMLGAALGIPVELALPENASEERKLILHNYGAKIHFTSSMQGTDGAQQYVIDLVNRRPDLYYYPDQYNNVNNWKSHYESTGPEIWSQTNEKVTHFVSGMGTSGTFVGTSRFLKPKGVVCCSVQPDNPLHGLEGWKHMETARVPGIYDPTIADRVIEVDTEDAFRCAIAAARYLGLLISPSAAANLFAASRLAKSLESGCVVTVLPDNGMKYLTDSFWKNNDYIIPNPF